jgi:hypothetical protein
MTNRFFDNLAAFLFSLSLVWASSVLADNIEEKPIRGSDSWDIQQCILAIYLRPTDQLISPEEPFFPVGLLRKSPAPNECVSIVADHLESLAEQTQDDRFRAHSSALKLMSSAVDSKYDDYAAEAFINLFELDEDGNDAATFHLWKIKDEGFNSYLEKLASMTTLSFISISTQDSNLEKNTALAHEVFLQSDAPLALPANAINAESDTAEYLNSVALCAKADVERQQLESSFCDEAERSLKSYFKVYFWTPGNFDAKHTIQTLIEFLEAASQHQLGHQIPIQSSPFYEIYVKGLYLFGQLALHLSLSSETHEGKWFIEEHIEDAKQITKAVLATDYRKVDPQLQQLYSSLSYQLNLENPTNLMFGSSKECDLEKASHLPPNQIPRDYQIKFINLDSYNIKLSSFAQETYQLRLTGSVESLHPEFISDTYRTCRGELFDDGKYQHPAGFLATPSSRNLIQDSRVSKSAKLPTLMESNLTTADSGLITWRFDLLSELENDFDLTYFPAEIPRSHLVLKFWTGDLKPFYTFSLSSDSQQSQSIRNASFKGIGSNASMELVDHNEWGTQLLLLKLNPQHIYYFAKVIFPALGFLLMGVFTLIRPMRDSEAHLQVATTAVLSAVAYQFVINDSLPPLNYLTLVDTFLLLMFVSLVFCVLFNLFPHFKIKRLGEEKPLMILRSLALICAIASVSVVLYGSMLAI